MDKKNRGRWALVAMAGAATNQNGEVAAHGRAWRVPGFVLGPHRSAGCAAVRCN